MIRPTAAAGTDNGNRIELRPARPCVGTRTVMAMRDFELEIPTMTATVSRWLEAHQVRPSGQPFLRYHTIDMPERMDVEPGMPITAQGEQPIAHASDKGTAFQSR